MQGAAGVIKRSLRELSFSELKQRAATSDAEGKNLVSVEIQKRFGFPFACVVFGLVGLPLGIVGARSGRSAGFALSIGIIVVYYVLFNTGEESARDGTIPPWLAVWLPNILFAAAGLWMLVTRNSDSGGGYWETIQPQAASPSFFVEEGAGQSPGRQNRRQRPDRPNRRRPSRPTSRSSSSASSSARSAISTATSASPSSVSSCLCSLSLVAIFIIADLTDNIEDFLRNSVSADVIVSHYRSKIMLVFYQISPIILLVSTIFTFAVLAKSNELVALRAIGLSFLRISAPVVFCSALLALGLYFLQARVLPEMNRDANRTRELIKRGPNSNPGTQVALGRDKQWIVGRDGHSIFNFLYFDESKREMAKLQGFFFDENFRIASRFFAEKANFLGDGTWLVKDGWKREFSDNVVTSFQKIEPVGRIRLAESPEFLRKGAIPADEMSNRELRDYLRDLEARRPQLARVCGQLWPAVLLPAHRSGDVPGRPALFLPLRKARRLIWGGFRHHHRLQPGHRDRLFFFSTPPAKAASCLPCSPPGCRRRSSPFFRATSSWASSPEPSSAAAIEKKGSFAGRSPFHIRRPGRLQTAPCSSWTWSTSSQVKPASSRPKWP